MRRVRLANVATPTTLVPRSRILPFTTSTRSWKTENGADEFENIPRYKPGEYWRFSFATGSNGQQPAYESGDFWRGTRTGYGGHVEDADKAASDTATVAIAGAIPIREDSRSKDGRRDEAVSIGKWQKTFSVYRHKFHRRVVQAKLYIRKAARHPHSGIGFVSLSPRKGLQTLPPFDSFWNVNFAAISAKYNLAYPEKHRVGELFVNDAIARRAFRWLQEQPVAARNELEGMRHVWASTAIFPVDEAKLHWWPTVMLWLLHNRPEFAAKFLLASYVEPYPPFYMVADSLEYLASYYLQSSEKHTAVGAEYFRAMFYVLLDACTATRPFISQKTIFLLATRSTTEQSIYLHEALEKAHIPLHYETLLHFAYVYAKEGKFRKALDVLEDAIVAGADPLSDSFLATCNKTLHCSVMHPDGYHASSYIVSRFIELGVEMNQRLYSVLIVNALAANDMPTALRVLSLLEENHVDVSPVTYSILLNGYKQMTNLPSDFEATIVRKAHDSAIRTQHSWLATEILHCAYLHHMKAEDGRLRDPIAVFHSTMATYGRYFKSWPLRVLGVHGMERQGWTEDLMEPTPAAINIVLTASLNAYPERAQSMFTQFSNIHKTLTAHKEKPFALLRTLVMNDYTYNIFLMALAQDSRNLQHCTTLVQQMGKGLPDELLPRDRRTKELVPAAQPTAWTWSILLHAFARHGQTAAAEKVMELMRKRGLEPTKVTWNSLIKGYAAIQDIPGAVRALTRMEGEGFDADEYTTSALKKIRDSDGLIAAWKERREGDDEESDAALSNLYANGAKAEARQRVDLGDGFLDSPTGGVL